MNVRIDGPSARSLNAGSVHLWIAGLSVSDVQCRILRALLSADERERADRFVFERDRRWFTAARGFLRSLLAQYVGVAPERLRFVYGQQDKPALHPEHGSQVAFNLTHSGGMAAIAVTAGSAVGIDIEQVRPVDDLDSLARQCFAPGERARLARLTGAARQQAFFRCWTRKEAYIKALGEGLSCPLESFEVTLLPGEPARLQSIDGSTAKAARWWVHAFTAGPGFAGAVVVDGTGYSVETGWIHAGAQAADAAQRAFA